MIPFNKPYLTGKEATYLKKALKKGRLSGNGYFTDKCHSFFKESYGFKNCFLTNSATSALEMAALLCDICEEDEVIIPSYTFVSTATPFALRGAKIVFCDSEPTNPNINVRELEKLITNNTKVIVVVHYSGFACDMEAIMTLANKHGVYVIEDAAHSITGKLNNSYLGTYGHFAAFSFHETKNISSGQGGLLVVNHDSFIKRAEKVWVKGTNQLEMKRGFASKYEWVDLGSNFYPSEITAAILFAQLQDIEIIQKKRGLIWNKYHKQLEFLEVSGKIKRPQIQEYQSNNYHIYYIICATETERSELISFLNQNSVMAVFHYLPLHSSPYIMENSGVQREMPYADQYSKTLLRLPFFVDLELNQVNTITDLISTFYKNI